MTCLLAIDTGAPRLALALLRADGGVDCLVETMAQGQAERLFPAIEDLLRRNGVGYHDLDRLAVTSGPGSFTGLRIGLSAARGLGLALGVPVLGVPTLLALSLPVAGPSTIRLDARRGEAYHQRFSGPGVPLDAAKLILMADAEPLTGPGDTLVTDPLIDMTALVRFAAGADPAAYPPEAVYVRGADAKPQGKFRVARVAEEAAP